MKQLDLYTKNTYLTLLVGNAFTKLTGPPEILAKLHRSFTIYDEECNPSRVYDSRVDYNKSSLIIKSNMTILSGLLGVLKEKLDTMNISYQIKYEIEPEHISLDIPDDLLDGIILRDYQKEMITKSLYHMRGIIESDTGSGKSAMIAGISKLLLTRLNADKIVIALGRIKLLNQMKEMLNSYGIHANIVGSGHKFQPARVILGLPIAFYRSIEKQNEISDYIENANVLIFDECLPGSTLIETREFGKVRINAIHDHPNITKVTSYNTDTNKFEECTIMRKIKSQRDVIYVTIEHIPKFIFYIIRIIDRITGYLSRKFLYI